MKKELEMERRRTAIALSFGQHTCSASMQKLQELSQFAGHPACHPCSCLIRSASRSCRSRCLELCRTTLQVECSARLR